MSKLKSQTATTLLASFTVEGLNGARANILSLYNNTLLVSCYMSKEMFVYDQEGHHLLTIGTRDNDLLCDAKWTSRCNIVYTTVMDKKVVVMSVSGALVSSYSQQAFAQFMYLSIASDGIIYIVGKSVGLYQSEDEGKSWSNVIKFPADMFCELVIKVFTRFSIDFWILTGDNYFNYKLRMISMVKGCSSCNGTWRDINVASADGNNIKFDMLTSLSFDGIANVFLSDWHNKTVHVLTIDGEYLCQLLSSDQIKNNPCAMIANSTSRLLFTGQGNSTVEVFHLTFTDQLICS